MAVPRIGSAGVNLPYPNINSIVSSNVISLAPCQKWIIPAGQFKLKVGPYTFVQEFDPVTQSWVEYGLPEDGYLVSDGVNFRLANLTGGVVGGLVTTAGTGYLTAPTVTASAGGALFRAILGGSVNSTVTVTSGGTGYNHVPSLMFTPPPQGGVPATATATVSGGAISAITVTNQGAGYTSAPSIIVTADPLDTITATPVLVTALTANVSTNVTAIVCTDPGTSAVTSVPTLTIAAAPAGGTTAVATAIMCFTVTGVTSIVGGTSYGPSLPFFALAPGYQVAGTQANTNPIVGAGLYSPRAFAGYGISSAGGAVVTSGFVISDGGFHQAVPSIAFLPAGTSLPTGIASATALVGGVTDFAFITQI